MKSLIPAVKKLKIALKAISKENAGFSLIEILVALTLLGLAGTFVVGKIMDNLEEGRVKTANVQINSFSSQLQEFRRKCGFYPTTEQGLEALVSKPSGSRECRNYPQGGFLQKPEIPLDPWENNYGYVSDGRDFNIYSYGADGLEGGEGYEADIYYKKKQ